MKNVQIRNVPDDVHAVLTRRAAASGMSLQEYLLGLLRESAGRPTVEEVLRRVSTLSGGRVGFEQAVLDIRAERDRR